MFEVMFLEQASSLERFDFLLEICKKKKPKPFLLLLLSISWCFLLLV